MTVIDLLNEHFLKWQLQSGERKKLKDFAEYLGIGESAFNLVINGHRKATRKFIIRCAQVLKDERFYEISGEPPDNSPMLYITDNLKKLTLEQQHAVWETISQYILKNEQDKDDQE